MGTSCRKFLMVKGVPYKGLNCIANFEKFTVKSEYIMNITLFFTVGFACHGGHTPKGVFRVWIPL